MVSHDVDVDANVIRITIVGPTDLPGFTATINALWSDPRLCEGMGILGDFTRVEGIATLDVAYECVRVTARLIERIGPFRSAIVHSRPANAGITNAASVFARSIGGLELRSFYDLSDATAWLAEGRPGLAS